MICEYRYLVIVHFVTYLHVIEHFDEILDEDRKQIAEQLIFQFGKLKLFRDKIGECQLKKEEIAANATISCIKTS